MESTELAELVALAKKKNKAAMEELYSKTNSIVYYSALGILKNENDAQDVVQDVYVKVYEGLNNLKNNNAFLCWLKTIVANTCKNKLKAKSPMIFSSVEEESAVLDTVEETGEDFLPDFYIDNAEKRNQIMNIIDSLSDIQRTTIILFYYDEMSIRDIAESMECSESTVESRIAYAKKHVKKEVEKLEQEGDKLYGVAVLPLPFLKKLFIEDAKSHQLPETVAKGIFENVMKASAVAGMTSTSGMAASSLFTKFAGLGALGKVAVVGVASAVIVGGSVGAVAVSGHINKATAKPVMAVSSSVSIAKTECKVASAVSSLSKSTSSSSTAPAKPSSSAPAKSSSTTTKSSSSTPTKSSSSTTTHHSSTTGGSTTTHHSSTTGGSTGGSTTTHHSSTTGGSTTHHSSGGSTGGSTGGGTDWSKYTPGGDNVAAGTTGKDSDTGSTTYDPDSPLG